MKIILFLLLFPITSLCQNTIGLPDVTNYSKQTYSAGLQNWDIKQDKNGIIYFANNEGLLTYDGKTWNLYPLPNRTIVRSIEIGYDNKIYVGGQDELGYFSPSENGQLLYHSLINLLPIKDRIFEDVWDIVSYNNSIFIRTNTKIFKLTNNKIETFLAITGWSYIGIANNKLYAHDFKTGILTFENNQWISVKAKSNLPNNDPITSIIGIANNRSIITTLKNGLYLFDSTGILKIASPNNTILQNERIFAATAINNEWIALATSNKGVIIIDHLGNIIQSFSKKEGLQNNNVLSVFLDIQKNIWLGLDNGIDHIGYNSPIKLINPSEQDGSGYTSVIFQHKLYLGTTNGLYSTELSNNADYSFGKSPITPVKNTKGQIWGLAVINNQLLLGKNEGAYTVSNNTATQISPNLGYWKFIPTSNTYPTPQLITGNYKSVEIFDFKNEQFSFSKKIEGFEESARFIAIDNNDNIWVSHPYHGIFKIKKDKNNNYTTEKYTSKNGLPSNLNNHVYKIKNDILIATEKGIYQYVEDKNMFEPSSYYYSILGNQSIRYLKEDEKGDIWFIHEKSLSIIDFSSKKPSIINVPELNNKMLSGFEFIYPINEHNILIGGQKGFYHLNLEKYKQSKTNIQVQIRKVKTTGEKDSIIFGGYFNDINENQIQSNKNLPKVSVGWKSIQFQFSSSDFSSTSNLQYSYRLKGFDESWSQWSEKTEKEYTNLPSGKFYFEVKAKNNAGKESPITSFGFNISPHWYQTLWSRVLYAILIAFAIYFLYKWQSNKFKNQQIKFKEEQLKLEDEKRKLLYIHELEIKKTEGELAALRNEKLEAEINFKNAELASSAMHLVKKGELLSKSKIELTHVMKGMDNPQAEAELKKMIKNLSEDDKMDKEWETFSKHFDTVHSQFLALLKEKHNNITGNDMKLCAYLRMNLSTKEIAQLMNISGRGVEIGRYRLRKKLQLPTTVSLFNYLIDIK